MANAILFNPASSGQSKTFTFSLTFTPETWQQFWHFLMVGCAMSDHLLNTPRPDLAATWNKLSKEVTSLLEQGKVSPVENETLNSR